MEAAGITTVIWSTGFGRDDRWIEVPIFNGRGYPAHDRGVTGRPGLYFIGLPWQYTWGSGRFAGVAADAEHLADEIAATRRGAVAEIDVDAALESFRRGMGHLRDRRPDTYPANAA